MLRVQNPPPYSTNVSVNVAPSITLNVPFKPVAASTFSLSEFY